MIQLCRNLYLDGLKAISRYEGEERGEDINFQFLFFNAGFVRCLCLVC